MKWYHNGVVFSFSVVLPFWKTLCTNHNWGGDCWNRMWFCDKNVCIAYEHDDHHQRTLETYCHQWWDLWIGAVQFARPVVFVGGGLCIWKHINCKATYHFMCWTVVRLVLTEQVVREVGGASGFLVTLCQNSLQLNHCISYFTVNLELPKCLVRKGCQRACSWLVVFRTQSLVPTWAKYVRRLS